MCSIEKFLQNTSQLWLKCSVIFILICFLAHVQSPCVIPFEKHQAHTQNRTQAELACN